MPDAAQTLYPDGPSKQLGNTSEFDGPIGQHGNQESDYDMAGAKAAGVQPDARGHWPDTYKLPSHITFSDDSVYHSEKHQGGHWTKLSDNPERWSFKPGPENLKNHSMKKLQDYFKRNEPDSELILPDEASK